MPTLEERVADLEVSHQTLADRQSIIELTGRYCRAVVNDDMETVLSLFTEDGCLHTQFPPGSGQDQSETNGRAALREAYRGTAGMQLKPCVHNHIVEVDGDVAHGFCSVEIRLVQNTVAFTSAGHYEDEYQRVGDRWHFRRRGLVLYHWVPQSIGWA